MDDKSVFQDIIKIIDSFSETDKKFYICIWELIVRIIVSMK